MKLKSMEFRRDDSWGACEKPMRGKLEFKDSSGEIMILVPEELCQRILAMCSALIKQRISEATEDMLSNVIPAERQLEHRGEE